MRKVDQKSGVASGQGREPGEVAGAAFVTILSLVMLAVMLVMALSSCGLCPRW